MTKRIKKKTTLEKDNNFESTETMVILISVDIDKITILEAFNYCC